MPSTLELALACPKAELHVHIEGTLEPELAFALAQRNGVRLPYATVDALRAAYAFGDLQSFLDLYYACAAVLCTADDFAALMRAYVCRAARAGVVHAEVFFDPQTHIARGVPLDAVLRGLRRGAAEAQSECGGVSVQLIMCFLRHLSADEAHAALDLAAPHIAEIDAFGLDSSERGNPPAKFAAVFERCRALGKPVVAHAGEEGPPAFVAEALDVLRVARVDHGVRCIEDAALVRRLAREQTPLTMCPLSNVRLGVFADMRQHTLPALLAHGVCVTINSDDPAYFGGYLDANIRAVHDAFALDRDAWRTLFANSFRASFVDAARRDAWLAAVDAHFAVSGEARADGDEGAET